MRDDYQSEHSSQEEGDADDQGPRALVPLKNNKINSGTHRSAWNKLAKIANSGDFPSISQVWNYNDRVKKKELLKNYVLSERNAEKVESELSVSSLRGSGSKKLRKCLTTRQMMRKLFVKRHAHGPVYVCKMRLKLRSLYTLACLAFRTWHNIADLSYKALSVSSEKSCKPSRDGQALTTCAAVSFQVMSPSSSRFLGRRDQWAGLRGRETC